MLSWLFYWNSDISLSSLLLKSADLLDSGHVGVTNFVIFLSATDYCIPISFLLFFRHESYRTQYRAMFVMNCTVIKEEILKYKGPLNKKTKRGHKKIKQSSESIASQEKQEEEEIYHPVKCTECSTEVAVLDKDEVFHFFNVLASHC